MKSLILALAVSTSIYSQAPPPTDAAISGVVRDKLTGKALPRYRVVTETHTTISGNNAFSGPTSKQIEELTDDSGHYRLSGLPPGNYRITVQPSERVGFAGSTIKFIAVAGQDIENINFDVTVTGTIKGHIFDENKEPVAGVSVILVTREYFLGKSGYYFGGFGGRTNDRGEYTINGVTAGQVHYLLAESRSGRMETHSDSPLNPKLRRKTVARTWYPNSPSADGAIEVILNPGEVREAVDVEMRKAPAYCASGTTTAAGKPSSLRFEFETQSPSSGLAPNRGSYIAGKWGSTGVDGQFRICDLAAGTYRIVAHNLLDPTQEGSPVFGVMTFSIGDKDLDGLKINAMAPAPLEGEVILDGPVPNTPLTAKVNLLPQPLFRTVFRQELMNNAKVDIPGKFTFPVISLDDYVLNPFLNAPGLYIKDITFADQSIRYASFNPSTAIGNAGFRVTIGQDGGTISATVLGRDSNPVPDSPIVIIPADTADPVILAAKFTNGQTDQNGQYTSQTLAPGKYLVGVSDTPVDTTVASIARLVTERVHFSEVTLAPTGQAQITLLPH